YCETLKQDPSAPLYGHYLAHKDNQQPDHVRHFGLGMVENTVRYRWTDGSIHPDTKEQIRANVISLVSEGIFPLMEERNFIKEKVARLFVEVAKREWPGVWDGMDAFLREQFYRHETSREMVLLILRSLCEDVFVFDDAVAGFRSKDLRAGLLVIMSSENILKERYPEGVKGHNNEVTLMLGESGNDGWMSKISLLLREIAPQCTAEAAAEGLDILACRNMTDAEREKTIWPFLKEGGVDLISQAYATYATQTVEGDPYIFVQKLVQATVNLGEQQMCSKRNTRIPDNLNVFLQLLYAMASHPSVLISSIVSFFWATILRHETLSKVHTLKPERNVIMALELYSVQLERGHENRREVDPVYRHFSTLDFDTVTEFRLRAAQMFQKAVDVIHLGVPVVPLDALLWVANRVSITLAIDIQPHASAKDPTWFPSFDGALTLMEVTVSSLTDIINNKLHPQSAQVIDTMNMLLRTLVDYNPKSPVALDRVIGSVHVFTDMFKLNSMLLFPSLNKLFKTVEYPLPDKKAHDIRDLRSRSATTLVKIGRAIPNTLYPIFGEVEMAVQRLIQQNIITSSEKKTLMSFLLVVGFNSNLMQDKRPVFEKIVTPVVNDFQAQDLTPVLSSPEMFLKFSGAEELSEAWKRTLSPQEMNQIQVEISARRSRLSWIIDALLVFIKETISLDKPQESGLWASKVVSLLPNLLSTIRCLNAACDPQQWVRLAPEMAQVLTHSAEEKEMMVTGRVATKSGATPELSMNKLTSDLRVWFTILRDCSYKLLAQLSTLGPAFYSIPSLPSILEQSLFSHVDSMSNRQLRFLIATAVQPIVLNCPTKYMSTGLAHLLGVLLPYLDQRLLKAWMETSEEGLIMDEKEDLDDLDISDEIVREFMLRDLSRSVAGFLHSMVEPSKGRPKLVAEGSPGNAMQQPPQQKETAPLTLFALSHPVISQSVVTLLCHLLTFKDTRTCVKASETAQGILAVLVQNFPATQEAVRVFSSLVLKASLEALHDPYHQEGQDKLVFLVTEVYVEIRALDETPKIALQQLLGADNARLEAFEQELVLAPSKTRKHALVRNFLQGIIGVAKSEWFKQKEQQQTSAPIRTIAGNYDKPSNSVLDSTQDEDIGDGLASLFDEE
ncbi:Exportin-5, partial [Lunasporangiospora selenospora]